MSLIISFVLVFHMVQKVCNPRLCSVLKAFLTSSTVSDDEHTSGTSSSDPSQERGLAFGWSWSLSCYTAVLIIGIVAYQSQIGNGFRFIQHSWANNIG
jgi:hypothetical protein